jgi:drug/metabolite transporter (DMT)-like permease
LTPFAIKEIVLLDSFNFRLIMIVAGITFITAIFNFEALKEGKLSIIDVILEVELPITIALGIFFFKESLSIFQITFIGFIFIGMILVATKSFSHWKTKLEKGVLIAFIAAILMGITNFATASSARSSSVLLTIWLVWISTAILSILIIAAREGPKQFFKNGLKFKWIILAMGIFDTFAWLFYAYAILDKEVSIVTAITESYPAIAIWLGFYINKEKINWHQWLGAAIALCASLILAFFA